jgi:PAS domain S-box-containing protein
VFNAFVDIERFRIRPISALLALLIALGLALRGRRERHIASPLSGLVVVILCGAQLAMFVGSGRVSSLDPDPQTITQNFAAGMFCIGSALVLDGVLPSRWGRHLLFGLLGAIAATIGVLGLVGLLDDLPAALEVDLLRGMRLPSALILLLGGLALLAGARLRSVPAHDARNGLTVSEELRDRTGLAAGLAMLLVTLGATLLIWREAENHVTEQAEATLGRSLERLASALTANALNSVALLDGLRGLFAASDQVDGDEWARYLDKVHLLERYVGVISVGFAVHVHTPVRDSEGARIALVDGKPLRIWPGNDHEEYFPIAYVMPGTDASRRVLGYDLGADAERAQTIDRARESDRAAISARIDFGEFYDPQRRIGFVIIAPVTSAAAMGSAASRNETGNSGFVYSAMDMRAIVEKSVVDAGGADLAVRISDADASSNDGPIFSDAGFDVAKRFHTAEIQIAGRTWNVLAQEKPGQHAEAASRMPFAVLVGGSFCALILFAITWVLAGHRARALHFAGLMNTELRKSQRAQQAITDTANAGIITADSGGNILYMNPSAANSFGVNAPAMIGQTLTVLMPERYRERHLAGLARVANGGPAHVIGHTVEMAGLRGDGSEFPIEVLLSDWSSDGQAFFTAFVRDITKRKRSEAELEQRTRELERSNADLEQFAYVASHDLQEPLRMVASYVQLLARRYRGRLDADADEFIGFAVDGATRMQRLIQDLLAYARLGRSGKSPIPTHVGECAESATAHLQEAIVESGARVRIDADCEAVVIPSQLTQVFQNLIANALKFSSEAAPEVIIDSVREGKWWHIRVRDNGIGIAAQHRDRVFAIFQRLHTRREYPGTGIGLAICRKIVESFGGSIWVESEPGEGSVFHFTLPAAEATT